METDYIEDVPVLGTRIPESRTVKGLKYGAKVSARVNGWHGYYVCLDKKWAIAKLTPASDELPGTGSDRAILNAIRKELEDLYGKHD